MPLAMSVQLGMSDPTLHAYVYARGDPRARATDMLVKRGVRSKITT
jgi:hypothetical protein